VVERDENALIQASGRGHLDTVKRLVSRGADVNARIWAERNELAFDRASGKIISLTSQDGLQGEWRSPLSMARRGDHRAVVEYLIAAGARD
jgi:hypothetical protein